VKKQIEERISITKSHKPCFNGGMRIRKCIWRDYADLAETEKEEIYNWVCHVLIMLQFEDYAQAFVKDERQGAISFIKHKLKKHKLIFTLP
jgi:hypothetical protein